MNSLRRSLVAVIALCASALAHSAAAHPGHDAHPPEDQALREAVASSARTDKNRARDAYRHPLESLTFWQIRPGMTIIEIEPGGEAWWSEILAPYARATGGSYRGTWGDLANPNMSDAAKAARANFEQRFGIQAVDFSQASGLKVEDASADFVLVARAFHNWSRREGLTERYMAEFFRALKPGGVLAVEQHRAAPYTDVNVTAPDGYVPQTYVIEAARNAGFVLEASSEINANPKDTRDHPFGVWTLPPIRQTAPRGQPADPNFDRSKYDAIGESDRMTLRFRKPA